MNTTLESLKMGSTSRVSKINCDGYLKRRFSDLGIISGTKIKPVFNSITGNPRAYEVRGSIIAIRNEDAKNIQLM